MLTLRIKRLVLTKAPCLTVSFNLAFPSLGVKTPSKAYATAMTKGLNRTLEEASACVFARVSKRVWERVIKGYRVAVATLMYADSELKRLFV
jgi:hypothetical protein